MKSVILFSFTVFVILSQVACSDSSGAVDKYAAANNCTIGGTSATTATAAAQGQVPCSLQSLSQNLATAIPTATVPTGLVATQVGAPATGVSVSQASLDAKVKAQSVSVQAQLAALGAEAPAVKVDSVESSRAPASVSAPAVAPAISEGSGEVTR